MESIVILMELSMKVIGKKISNMVRELKLGLMVLNTTVNIFMVKNMGKVDSHGQMAVLILVLSKKIIYKVMELIIGLTEDNLLEHGLIIKWKEAEHFLGQTEENTKVIM